jgi:hypothetical protein
VQWLYDDLEVQNAPFCATGNFTFKTFLHSKFQEYFVFENWPNFLSEQSIYGVISDLF